MSGFVRIVVAVVVGLVVWVLVATGGNMLLRALLAGYAQAEPAFQFTSAMLVGRLALGAVSTVAAGLASARSVRSAPAAGPALAIVLLLLFVPMHAALWTHFPGWYHAAFLVSLAPLALLGARLGRRSRSGGLHGA